jgi:hypothetical protein
LAGDPRKTEEIRGWPSRQSVSIESEASHTMSTLRKRQLLQQIAAIPGMERGKLSAYSFKERSGVAGPYHKLQHWQDGKMNFPRWKPPWPATPSISN